MFNYFSIAFLFILHPFFLSAQSPDSSNTISLLFMGDIMGHTPQIHSAYDTSSKQYNYDTCFSYVKPVFSSFYSVANLEVTLAGAPYSGYPQFSSPDALAGACKNAGITLFVTANNHSCDRGQKGIIRTIQVLDSLQIPHLGTYRDSAERANHYPLIVNVQNFKLAFLNYTYGTNGITVPKPVIVNLIDTAIIAQDIEKARNENPDQIIVIMHWGNEYDTTPNLSQKSLAEFCFIRGADMVIGSHPHVLQRMEWTKDTITNRDKLVVYSMGNYISNQRKPKTDGGAMVGITLKKVNNINSISQAGYFLTWVYNPVLEGKRKYYILPCSQFENNREYFQNDSIFKVMKTFIKDSRKLFKQNIGMDEYQFRNDQWVIEKESVK